VAHWLHERSGRNPLISSVSIAVIALITLLVATDTPYDTYFQGAQFVHFLLGPATVALGVPLYTRLGSVRRLFVPMLAALVAGSVYELLAACTPAGGAAFVFAIHSSTSCSRTVSGTPPFSSTTV
jgi:putative effector of murein hydrolase